jgi:hypothetical protein
MAKIHLIGGEKGGVGKLLWGTDVIGVKRLQDATVTKLDATAAVGSRSG